MTNLTEKQLHQIINYIRTKFKKYIILSRDQYIDLRSNQFDWSKQTNYLTIDSMKDDVKDKIMIKYAERIYLKDLFNYLKDLESPYGNIGKIGIRKINI